MLYAATDTVEIENGQGTDAVGAKLLYAYTHVLASIILGKTTSYQQRHDLTFVMSSSIYRLHTATTDIYFPVLCTVPVVSSYLESLHIVVAHSTMYNNNAP